MEPKILSQIFRFFQVLHLVRKQTYNLKLPARWKIYNMFYVLLLEQDIVRKRQINKFLLVHKFEASDNK